MLVQTSVTTTSAPRTASAGFAVTCAPRQSRSASAAGSPSGAPSRSSKPKMPRRFARTRAPCCYAQSPTNAMLLPATPAELLLDREEVGEDLHRVAAVGEPVDHGHGRGLGEGLEPVVAVGAEHDRVDVARERRGRCPRSSRRARSGCRLVGSVDRVAAELARWPPRTRCASASKPSRRAAAACAPSSVRLPAASPSARGRGGRARRAPRARGRDSVRKSRFTVRPPSVPRSRRARRGVRAASDLRLRARAGGGTGSARRSTSGPVPRRRSACARPTRPRPPRRAPRRVEARIDLLRDRQRRLRQAGRRPRCTCAPARRSACTRCGRECPLRQRLGDVGRRGRAVLERGPPAALRRSARAPARPAASAAPRAARGPVSSSGCRSSCRSRLYPPGRPFIVTSSAIRLPTARPHLPRISSNRSGLRFCGIMTSPSRSRRRASRSRTRRWRSR